MRPSFVGGSIHNDAHDWQVELPGKFRVAFVVGGHGHDGTGTVASQDVIGDPNRDRLARDGVGGVGAAKDTCLFTVGLLALDITLGAGGLDVGGDDRLLIDRHEFRDQRVLGSDNHECRAE